MFEKFEKERKEKLKQHQIGLILKTRNISDKENQKLEGISLDNQRLM